LDASASQCSRQSASCNACSDDRDFGTLHRFLPRPLMPDAIPYLAWRWH
jgi:hypothetical protein